MSVQKHQNAGKGCRGACCLRLDKLGVDIAETRSSTM